MRIVDIGYARFHLLRIVDDAAAGAPFMIAVAGKPVVKVEALDTPVAEPSRRVGFMVGEISVPDDFDRMGAVEIGIRFQGADPSNSSFYCHPREGGDPLLGRASFRVKNGSPPSRG